MAVGFLFVNFLRLFDATATCEDYRKVYPRSVFVIQREGCPWGYAVDKKTADQLKCFNKERWGGKKPPESMRDTEQLLVPRVKAWYKRWIKETRDPDKQHAFAVEQVLWCGVVSCRIMYLILSLFPFSAEESSAKGAVDLPENSGRPRGGRPGARKILPPNRQHRQRADE